MRRLVLLIAGLGVVSGIICWFCFSGRRTPQSRPTPTQYAGVPSHAQDRLAELNRELREVNRKEQEARRQRQLNAMAAEEPPVDRLLAGHPPQKWTALPDWVQDLRVDSTGRAWVMRSPTLSREDDPTGNASDALAGKTHVLRCSRFLARDRKGRLYAGHYGASALGRVDIYENGAWSQLTLDPSKAPKQLQPSDDVQDCLQDTAGNLWFLYPAGVVIERRASDDQWQCFVIEGLPDTPFHDSTQGWRLTEQQPGRLVAYKRSYTSYTPSVDAHIGYYDGKQWKAVPLGKGLPEWTDIYHLVPLADGAIILELSDYKFGLFWPDPSLANGPGVAALIPKLDDDDATVRDFTTWSLAQRGSVIRPSLQAALSAGKLGPEGQLRAREILNRWDHPEGTENDASSSSLLANRYKIGFVYSACAGSNGREARFLVHDVTDTVDKKTYDTCVLIFTSDGNVSLKPQSALPKKNIKPLDDRSFLDSKGRLWVSQSFLIEPDGSIAASAPPGLPLNQVLGETTDGKILARSGGTYLVYDPAAGGQDAAGGRDAIASKHFNSALAGYDMPTRRLWLSDEKDKLAAFTEGHLEPIPLPAELGALEQIIPLRGHGMLMMTAGGVYSPEDKSHEWQMYQLVKQDPAQWAKRLPMSAYILDEFLVGADGQSIIWASGVEDDQIGTMAYRHLRCFDGTQWHDLNAKFGIDEGVRLWCRVADEGKTMICLTGSVQNSSLTAIRVAGTGIASTPLLSISREHFVGVHYLRSRACGGRLYFAPFENNGKSLAYQDGKCEMLPFAATPQLADSKRRTWFTDVDAPIVYVIDNGAVAKGKINMRTGDCVMAEGTDGRIWLLHSQGLSELKLEGDKVTQARTINWSAPKTQFGLVMIDDANGLWDTSAADGLMRYELPAPPDGGIAEKKR